jgi:thymidylate synthase
MDTSVKTIEIEDGVNGYVDLVHHVLNHGAPSSPRGMETLEIEDAVIHIHDVYNTLPLGVGRGTVPGIGAVEATQLLAGTSVPELVIAIGPQFKNYTEDNGKFHGAYGLRTEGQYEVMLQRLRKDPDTRQAVVTIWDPQYDTLAEKRDYPCTVLHQFRIRKNRLNMSVYMRSNDVWLGAAYDFFQFTRVQLAMASILGIEPGTYSHHVGSLHLYESNFDKVSALVKTDTSAYETIPYFVGHNWASVRAGAQRALDAAQGLVNPGDISYADRWYSLAMIRAIRRNEDRKNAS